MRRAVTLVFAATIILAVPSWTRSAEAQVTTATISGTVMETSQAVVPGTSITITNVDTGVGRTTVTDPMGRYRVSNLAIGPYQVEAELDGFKKEVRTGIILTVGREAVVNFTLQVGQITEEVVVTGEAPLVNTTTGEVSGLVDQKTISELPLNGRDLMQLGHLGIRADYAVEAGLTGLIHPYGIAMATTSDPRVREEIERRMPDYQARREYYPYHELSPAGYQRLITLMLGRHVFFNPTFGAQFRGVYPQGQAFDEYARTFLGDHRVEFPELAPVWTDLLPFHTRLRSHSIDEPQRRVLVDGMEKLARFMREFSAAGGKMIAGTDVSRSGVPGLHVHRELELWVQNGVRPIEALRAATMYPAELLRQERDLGTIAVGKLADLLVVEGNPLDDVRATRNILHVIKEGRVLARPVPVGPVALAASAAWRESRQR